VVARIKFIGSLPKGGSLKLDPFIMCFVVGLAPHFIGRPFGEIRPFESSVLHVDGGAKNDFNVG
jgi:hypothetical protein